MRTFIILIFAGFYLSINAQSDSSGYQLLWEITGKNLKKPSYLFGSMHSNDPRLFQFPDSLYSAFLSAEAVVLETDVSALFDAYDVRLNVFALDLFDKNRTFNSSKEATSTVYGSEDGRPQFLDAYFQQAGLCGGKTFFALETFEEQLAASEKIGEMSARSAINNYFFSEERFTQTYLQGDIVALNKMLKAQLNGMPGAYETLVSDRNKKMAVGLDTLMRKRSVFCVIGSAHLNGIDGVIQLLRKQGYTLRKVSELSIGTCENQRKEIDKWRKYPVISDRFEFSTELSGKPIITETASSYHYVYQELGQGNRYELFIKPSQGTTEELSNEFIHSGENKPVSIQLTPEITAMQGLVNDVAHGYLWKQVFYYNGLKYELICSGGNKFMHSNRPKTYFSKFKIRS